MRLRTAEPVGPSCAGREPTANGRAAQETLRAPATGLDAPTAGVPHRLFLAFLALCEAGPQLEVNLTLTREACNPQGSNV